MMRFYIIVKGVGILDRFINVLVSLCFLWINDSNGRYVVCSVSVLVEIFVF